MHRQTLSFILIILMGITISLTGCITSTKLQKDVIKDDIIKLKAVLISNKDTAIKDAEIEIEYAYWLYEKTPKDKLLPKDKPFLDYFIDDYICPKYHIAPWAVKEYKEMLKMRMEKYAKP